MRGVFGCFSGFLVAVRGAFGAGWFWRCLGMWGNLLFALVSALCTSVQISIFGGLKSTSRGCFRVVVWVRARFGGLVAGCGCDKLSLVGGLGGVLHPLCMCLYSCCLRTPVSGVVLVGSLHTTCFLWYSYRVIMWWVIVTCYRFLFCSFGGIVSYGF